MKSKKALLRRSRLYLIIDKKICADKPPLDVIRLARDAGVDIFQLRDKESSKKSVLEMALRIRKLLYRRQTIFIINDDIDIARIVDSDGVHLGQGDFPLKLARKILGQDKIIGISCANLNQAKMAQRDGADYIGIGPLFHTSTKSGVSPVNLSLIAEIRKKIAIPFFVLGGIREGNLNEVLSRGARRIAVCSAICQSDDIASSARRLRERLN